jgi:hypothetical protein
MWMKRQMVPDCPVHALTAGSLIGTDMLITMAFHEQFNNIGWHNMFHGRISKLWGRAVCEIIKIPYLSFAITLSAQTMLYLWKYARSLWIHRNQVVHGKTDQEIAAKIRETSHNQVRDLYTQFQTNPTFILSCHHYLFTSRSLEQRLKMDIDSITCWLRSVEDAKRALEYHNTQLRLQSNTFFAPFYAIGRARARPHSSSSDSDYSMSTHDTSSHEPSTTTNSTSSMDSYWQSREDDQLSTTTTSANSLDNSTDTSSLGTFISTDSNDPPSIISWSTSSDRSR